MGHGTRSWNRMILDDGIMHGVGTCHGMSLHATNDGIVGTRHGVSPPPGVSKTAIQFGTPVSGSVSVIINQFKATVRCWGNKNGHKFFQWQLRFYDHTIMNNVGTIAFNQNFNVELLNQTVKLA